MKHAVRSLQELSTALNFPVAALPLYVSDSNAPSIAYTSRRGIYVHGEILRKYPQDVKVYTAHEIFHWVIDDSAIHQQYSPEIVGYATDYRINALLKSLYGYDVRKASVPGIYRKDFVGKTLPEIARRLRAEGKLPSGKPCGGIGFPHPTIAECATHLRTVLKLPDVPAEPFEFTKQMNSEFYAALASFDTRNIVSSYPLDLLTTIRAIWAGLYCETPKHTANKGDTLYRTRAFVYSIPYDRIRHKTIGDATYSLWVAAKLLLSLEYDSQWIHKGIERTKGSISRLEYVLAERMSAKRRLEYRRKLESAKRRLLRWRAMPALAKLFKMQVPVQNANRAERMGCLMNTEVDADEAWLPAIRRNELVRRIQRHANNMMDEVVGADQMMTDLTRSLGESIEDYAENEAEEAKERKKKEKKEKYRDPEPEIQDDEPDTDSDEGAEEDEDEGDDGEGPPDDEEDEGQASDASDDDDGDGYFEVADNDAPDLTESEAGDSDSGGSVAGKGQTDNVVNVARYDSYDMGFQATDVLSKIYEAFVEVETLLQKVRSRIRKPDEFGQDAIYEYGNDASRAVAEELAMLENEDTKLLFLARMAQHELLLRAPQKRARSSVILALDASGSMSGRHYALAVGFLLAVVKWMHRERRGIGIIMFSGEIDSEYYVNPGKPLSLNKIIHMALKPSFGGTCFDRVINYAFRKAAELKWSKVNVQLLTDGGDVVREPEEIALSKGKHNKLISMVTSKQTQGLAEVSDEIYNVKGDDMHLQLVKTSGTIFN